METSWRSCAIWDGKEASEHGHGDCIPPGPRGPLPPPWPAPAAPPAAHCARSGSGSASAGTAQCAPPAPGPAPSARAGPGQLQPVPCSAPLVLHPQVPWSYLLQQVGDSIDVVVGLGDPGHPLSAQDWGRRAKGEPSSSAVSPPSHRFPSVTPRDAHGENGRWLLQVAQSSSTKKELLSAWQHQP